MANLPLNQIPISQMPFLMNLDTQPFYNQGSFPNITHRRYHTPLDMQTMGLISALAPHLRHLDVQGKSKEDLAHIPPKHIKKHKEHDFHIYLDVGLFSPEELTVKIINDHLVIEGKHEERQADDVGYVSRHFVRRYELPKGYNPDNLVSKLSSDGILSVLLPKPTNAPKERIITIQRTGPNDLFLKNKSIKNGDDKDTSENCDEEDKRG